ncbi:unnamed protein product [Cylindrotheca closterium]|uniref:Helicase-associated domain-containing protein n=1 Tax=Cylindrotheca closterium TaxID=2856 RepID=A0AAD2CM79_9STRA|nr:unnamed protein product [Cylindrotheca closterium]
MNSQHHREKDQSYPLRSHRSSRRSQSPPKIAPDMRWKLQFEKLAAYMKIHHPDGGYGKLTPLTDDRIEKLESIGFEWEHTLSKNNKSNEANKEDVQQQTKESGDDDDDDDDEPNTKECDSMVVLSAVEPATFKKEERDKEQFEDASNSLEPATSQKKDKDQSDEGGDEDRKPAARAGKRKRSKSNAEWTHQEESEMDESEMEFSAKRKRGKNSETRKYASASTIDRVSSSPYEEAMKQNLPRLLTNQLDLMEYVKEENSTLKSHLIDKESDWLEHKQYLEERIRTLEQENEDLIESHKEEKAHWQRERQRRKHAEQQLKKLKKKIVE